MNSGSTAVVALLVNKVLYIAWAGDSQAALMQNGSCRQLVNPHRPERLVSIYVNHLFYVFRFVLKTFFFSNFLY